MTEGSIPSITNGRFRGGNHYAHEVDVIVEVAPEQIKASGRFGPAKSIPLV